MPDHRTDSEAEDEYKWTKEAPALLRSRSCSQRKEVKTAGAEQLV
jgi:hypothetical protein